MLRRWRRPLFDPETLQYTDGVILMEADAAKCSLHHKLCE